MREFHLATENYTEIFGKFDFGRFLWNSVFITVVATLDHAAVQRDGRLRALEVPLPAAGRPRSC